MEINPREVYTTEETQKILKISTSTMMRLIKKGIIRAAKVGKQYRILGKELLRLVSPELEDKVGKVYGKGREWVHRGVDEQSTE
ncbi:MAG: helix-turn-helix domain-containing protein [Candidatus Omnitrophica bacterium]|nr:helix-turn-helix domain-containing protein [Candidatus Omnitrophota bacterium]MDD4012793.1 helix-turn-helix domain-containing protein [Candidatus Omnitrophota bacterium]